MRGHATGDPVHFRAAFLPSARIKGIRDGAFQVDGGRLVADKAYHRHS
ncbi:nuclear transport factor 2 family protein [Streptomyces sp. R-07]